MVLDLKETTVGYRCPHCGSHVLSVVGIFALSGDLIRLKCQCGGSALTVEYSTNGKVRLSVPCTICPHDHVFNINSTSFFDRELITLQCPVCPIDICFIGKKEAVLEDMRRSDKDLLNLLAANGLDDFESFEKMRSSDTSGKGGFFDNGTTLYDMANFMLSELAAEGKVECHCGGSEDSYGFELLGDEEDSVRFFCRDCSSSAVYPASELFYSDGSFRTEKIYLL